MVFKLRWQINFLPSFVCISPIKHFPFHWFIYWESSQGRNYGKTLGNIRVGGTNQIFRGQNGSPLLLQGKYSLRGTGLGYGAMTPTLISMVFPRVHTYSLKYFPIKYWYLNPTFIWFRFEEHCEDEGEIFRNIESKDNQSKWRVLLNGWQTFKSIREIAV